MTTTINVRLVQPINLNGQVFSAGTAIDAQPLFAITLVLKGAAVFVDREAGYATVFESLEAMHDEQARNAGAAQRCDVHGAIH